MASVEVNVTLATPPAMRALLGVFVWVPLLAGTALADDVTHTTLRVANGVTSSQLASATSAVPVGTFSQGRTTWTLACKGSGREIRCEVSSGSASATIVSATARAVTLDVHGATYEVSAAGLPFELGTVGWQISAGARRSGAPDASSRIAADGVITTGEISTWERYGCSSWYG
jgi:hypothetical protein